jgi:uncharacterized protein (TIGR02722 family)
MKTPVCLKTAALGTVLLTSAWILAGCQTTDTRTIDSKGPESLNTSAINPQDWANAADQLVQSLLSSGALATSPRQPAILAIDRVINNTSLSIDTDLLIKKIRVALTQSGKVALINTMGLGERAVVAAEAEQMEEMLSPTGKRAAQAFPDYTLYAKLIQQTDRANGTTQNTYTFQMSLVDVRSGLTVWEEEKEIAKQTKRAAVGW